MSTESAGGYRKLGRNGSGHHGLRSFSNFLLLLSAVILFSLLYLYFGTSNELQSFRNDYEELNSRHLKVKNELLDVNLKLEQLKKDAAECSTSKDSLNGKYEVCQKDLSEKGNKLAEMESQQTNCDGKIRELNDKLELASKRMEEKIAANQRQQASVANLTEIVEKLRKELDMARTAIVLKPEVGALTTKFEGIVKAMADANTMAPLEVPSGTTLKAENKGHEQDPPEKGDGAHERQSSDFIAPKRSPGGRVQLEEENAQREKFANHKELLKAAAKDKQQEEEEELADDGAEKEETAEGGGGGAGQKQGKSPVWKGTTGTATEGNRPLVDALHGIVA